MLRFASVPGGSKRRPASLDAAAPASLDRASRRVEYEAALRLQGEEKHEEAAKLLVSIRDSLSSEEQEPAGAKTRRDEVWLQRLHYLTLRNLAVSYLALGQHAQAFQALRGAHCVASLQNSGGSNSSRPAKSRRLQPAGALVGASDEDGSLWRSVAECAASSGCWSDARLAYERCACFWPGDPVVLRGLARSLLMLGDLRACSVVLELLSSGPARVAGDPGASNPAEGLGVAGATGLLPREAWLLQQLRAAGGKRGSNVGGGDRDSCSDEQLFRDYEELTAQRAKRLRAEAALQAPMVVLVVLEEPSLRCLLEATKKAAEGNLAPSQPVLLKLRNGQTSAAAAGGGQVGSQGNSGPQSASSLEPTCRALWGALRPMLARPWPEDQSAPQFALAVFQEDVATADGGGSSEEMFVSELLNLDRAQCPQQEQACSPARPWREWLGSILRLVLGHGALLCKQKGARWNLRAVVDLAVLLVLLSGPKQNSEALRRGVPKGRWLAPKLLAWIVAPQSTCEDKGCTRVSLRHILSTHGLDLAEACVFLASRDSSLDLTAADFLKAWRTLQEVLPEQAIADLDTGSMPAAEAVSALVADRAASTAVLRYLWLAASLDPAGSAAPSLQCCAQLAEALEQQNGRVEVVARFIGAPISAARCRARLGSVAGAQQGQGPERGLADVACELMSTFRLPGGGEPLPEEDESTLSEFHRLATEFVTALRPPGVNPGGALESEEVGQEAADTARRLLQVLAGLLGQFAKEMWQGASCDGARDWHLPLLVRTLRLAANLLEVLRRRTGRPAQGRREQHASGGPSAGRGRDRLLFRGMALDAGDSVGGSARGLFLAPACEQVGLAALLLATGAGRAGGAAWLCAAHGALALGAKAVSCILLAAGSPPLLRGGLLMVEAEQVCSQEEAATSAASPPAIWLSLSGFLAAAHDLGLLLPELFAKGGVAPGRASHRQPVGPWAEELFGAAAELREQGSRPAERESPLSLPHILVSSALRVNCSAFAAWREEVLQWAEPARSAVTSAPAAPGRVTMNIDDSDAEEDPACEASPNPSTAAAAEGSYMLWCQSSLRVMDGPDWDPPLQGFCDSSAREFETDQAACKVAARGLACMCTLPGIDPAAPRAIASRTPEELLRLSTSAPYKAAIGVSVPQQQEEQAGAPPHLLSLALIVHRCLLRHCSADGCAGVAAQGVSAAALPSPQPLVLDSVLTQLDARMFPAGGAPSWPLPHPLLLPRSILEIAQEYRAPQRGHALRAWSSMAQTLKSVRLLLQPTTAKAQEPAVKEEESVGSGRPDRYPAELFRGSREGLHAAHEALDNAREALHELEWPSRKRLKDISGVVVSAPNLVEADQRVEQERSAALQFASCIEGIPPAPLPLMPALAEAYGLALSLVASPKSLTDMSDVPEAIELLVLAAKDASVGGPARWEALARAATAFRRLFFSQDQKQANEDELTERLRCWACQKQAPIVWGGRLRWLYGQARTLCLVLWARAEQELNALLKQLAVPEASEEVRARCGEVAHQWLSRQLDLLSLYRARRKSLLLVPFRECRTEPQDPASEAEAKGWWLHERIDSIAQQVTWFLTSCTDLASVMARSQAIIKERESSWMRPSFAAAWDAAAGAGSSPLLTYSGEEGDGTRPAPYLWYAPYVVARGHWQLLVSKRGCATAKGGKDALRPEEVLALLQDASEIEAWATKGGVGATRAAAAKPAASRPQLYPTRVPLRARDGVKDSTEFEPQWRLQVLRLRVARDLPGGAGAAGCGSSGKAAAAKTIVADAFKAMALIAAERSTYSCRLILERARHMEAEGRFADAARTFLNVITFPNTFPEKGYIGLLVVGHVELHSYVGDLPYPWEQHALGRRKYNALRCRQVAYALRLHGLVARQVLPDGSAFETEEAPAAKPERAGPEGWQPCSVSQAVVNTVHQALEALDEGRPPLWEALRITTGNLVVLARGTKPQLDSRNDSKLWAAARTVAIETLKRTFAALVRARPGTGASKPFLDWELLAILRSACIGVHNIGYVDDARRLRELYALAVGQIRSWAPRSGAPAGSAADTRLASTVAAAEGLFQGLQKKGKPGAPPLKGRWGSTDEPWLTVSSAAQAAAARGAAAASAVLVDVD